MAVAAVVGIGIGVGRQVWGDNVPMPARDAAITSVGPGSTPAPIPQDCDNPVGSGTNVEPSGSGDAPAAE